VVSEPWCMEKERRGRWEGGERGRRTPTPPSMAAALARPGGALEAWRLFGCMTNRAKPDLVWGAHRAGQPPLVRADDDSDGEPLLLDDAERMVVDHLLHWPMAEWTTQKTCKWTSLSAPSAALRPLPHSRPLNYRPPDCITSLQVRTVGNSGVAKIGAFKSPFCKHLLSEAPSTMIGRNLPVT
jgi:hypothetical protein